MLSASAWSSRCTRAMAACTAGRYSRQGHLGGIGVELEAASQAKWVLVQAYLPG
jgi:hypothetical protein